MSYLVAAPDMLAAAASDMASIGESLSAAHSAAAAPTTAVMAAAADEVSAAIASLFSSHGQAFQALSAQAATFHTEFLQALNGAGQAYAPTEALLGRKLIGNGTNGAPGTGQAGGAGGILLGNGGNGGSGAPGRIGGKGG